MKKNKYSIQKDPNKIEEANKYDNPIPSRDVIINYLSDLGAPVLFESIFIALQLSTEEHRIALRRRLKAMERDGQLIYNRKGFYGLVKKMDLFEGRIISSGEGPGLVQNETGETLYLSSFQMRCVFHGDKVVVRPSGINIKGKLEGEIVDILARNTNTIIGRYEEEFDAAYVIPINSICRHDILIIDKNDLSLSSGMLVNVEIISQPTLRTQPVGKVTSIQGTQVSISEAISMATETYDLPHIWSKEVGDFIKKVPSYVSDVESAKRQDLRKLNFVTIDGADAKDFDDAVYCEVKNSGGWRLFVAIADVSNYVRQGTALDFSARERSTSVYFPNYVIPMLPEKLSNELCSLQPLKDRLSLVCEMTISQKGRLSGYKFYSAVINSKARLTYTQVANLLENNDKEFYEKYNELVPDIFNLYSLYLTLHEKRKLRGAIDFDVVETQINLNKRSEIESIRPRSRNDAHRIIEECMLLANVSAAKFIQKNSTEAPYRVHGLPLSDRIKGLREFLKNQGLSLGGGDTPTPKDYSEMLNQAKSKPNFDDIQLVALRSMNQAIYTPDNDGHFGLAYNEYTHFTSPIRRYPDLIVHRVIKSIIGEKKLGAYSYSKQDLIGLCDHASSSERRADSASRDVEDWLKCSFMKPRIGDQFKAKIVSVMSFGFFVRLSENYIDGLVHISSLNTDYFHFDGNQQQLLGEKSRKIYKLGDEVEVVLISVNMTSFKIDFELVCMHSKNQNKYSKGLRSRVKSSSGVKHVSSDKKLAKIAGRLQKNRKEKAIDKSTKAKKIKNKNRVKKKNIKKSSNSKRNTHT